MNWRDYNFQKRTPIPADWATWVTRLLSNIQPGGPGIRVDYSADRITLTPTGPGDGTDDQGVIPFLGYPYNDSGTIKLRVAGGTVYAPGTVQAVTGADYALGTERWVFVQVAIADGAAPYTVTATIQSVTGASAPTFFAWGSSTITIKWLIGHLTSADEWEQLWDGGDIYLPALAWTMSIVPDSNGRRFQLVNDEATPGELDIYAYLSSAKGWKALTDLLKGLAGYNASNHQALMNDQGTITWVDVDTCA